MQAYFSMNYLRILEINDKLKGEGWVIKKKDWWAFKKIVVKYVT